MDVEIRMLGEFSVTVDRVPIAATSWTRRGPASLVMLLALADGRTMHREQVIDALWPTIPLDAALPRLHKAAHYARRALGGSVVLRNDQVLLLPEADVRVDAVEFRHRGERALTNGSVEEAEAALALYGGSLLPDYQYEEWTAEWRNVLTVAYHDLLRLAERWSDLVRGVPTDETAHLAVAREQARRGDVRAAQRQLERMEQALRRELGTLPSAEARRLKAELATESQSSAHATAPPSTSEATRLVGRRSAGDTVRRQLDQAATGHGGTLLLTGPAGVGKSAMLDMATALARRRGWRTARGAASSIEGGWPYAPVLEAFGDLCRQHPALLDGLDDRFRLELDRALSGEQGQWTGESAHQRLFVAAAELFRLAAGDHGLLLAIDDLHEADEASVRLLHYLARCAVTEPAVIALASRPDSALRKMESSVVARGIGNIVELTPLDESATRRLIALNYPDLEDDTATEIWAVSGGLPFRILEASRAAQDGTGDVAVSTLPPSALTPLRRVALLGEAFTTDEFLAAAGMSENESYEALEAGLATAILVPADHGYRFRHSLVRDALLATFSAHERTRAGREVAEQLAALAAPAVRVAHLFVASGHPVQAIPYVRQAVETAGALGAYRDGLALIEAVIDHTSGADRGHLLARRGDLLFAIADPAAVPAYRAALMVTSGTEHRLVRARLARAAIFQGDFDTAAVALAGLELDGDIADGPILLSRGILAYFQEDMDRALEAADAARAALRPGDTWQIADLVTLQGLIAHQRGEWFERFLLEMRRTQGDPGLTTAVFDAHLCVAEYLLYGPVDYTEVIELADQLRKRAHHDGALRGVAFATALIGEAGLLMGDLDLAERELREAVDLHRDIDAPAGEAHSLQRLAEVHLARDDREGALELLRQALPLARWSAISLHLMQRIYGTMIMASADPVTALAVVEQGEAALGNNDRCSFCDIMFEVPAAIACADAGDVMNAERHLSEAERSAARWQGSAWSAAVAEARAHLAAAHHDDEAHRRHLDQAARLYTRAGQPLDAARCSARLAGSATALPG